MGPRLKPQQNNPGQTYQWHTGHPVLPFAYGRICFSIVDTHRNPYDDISSCDIRAEWTENYLNTSDTKRQLGVPEDVWFQEVDQELYQTFAERGVTSRDSVNLAEELLEQGYRVLVYAGATDWFCNAEGERALVDNLLWRHQPTFRALATQPYKMNGRQVGSMKQFEGLTVVEVFDAGHMVPADKPEEALFLIEPWLRGPLKST
ncbi:hypothetical protein ACJ41O_006797 [Fusarium nematophilum]